MMISLPSNWVKENSLDKGSEVEVEVAQDKTIIISTSEIKKSLKDITIKLNTSTESSIRTLLTNAYRLGYDKLKIIYNKQEDIKTIKKTITNNLLGYELTESKKEFCIIENITEPSSDHTDKVFLKVIYGIGELIKDVENIFDGVENYETIEELEEKIKQYDNFVRRSHSKNPNDEMALQWIFHNQLMHAQREVFLIYLYIKNKKIKINENIKIFFNNLKEIYGLLKEGYLKKDITYLEKIHKMEKQITYEKGYDLLKKTKGEETIILHRIMAAIRNFYLCASPLQGILLWKD